MIVLLVLCSFSSFPTRHVPCACRVVIGGGAWDGSQVTNSDQTIASRHNNNNTTLVGWHVCGVWMCVRPFSCLCVFCVCVVVVLFLLFRVLCMWLVGWSAHSRGGECQWDDGTVQWHCTALIHCALHWPIRRKDKQHNTKQKQTTAQQRTQQQHTEDITKEDTHTHT